jgi:hypothetical protein
LSAQHFYWPAILCVCLVSASSHAFFPIEGARSPLVRVSNSASGVERLRTIPEDAKRGDMWPPQGRQVRIDDTIMTLAPGATIRDMNNRVVLPGSLRRPKKIRYTLDMYGQVKRIWISPTGGMPRHRPLPPTPHE